MDSTTNLNEAVDNPRSRRALLAGVVGGLGAWLVSAAQRAMPADAANGDPVILGALNNGKNTKIEGASDTDTALFLDSSYVGLDSFGGINGVIGRSSGETGVAGFSDTGFGMLAESVHGDGMFAETHGSGPHQRGIWAVSNRGRAVQGTTKVGWAGWFEGRIFATSFIELAEMPTPGRPDANRARLFVRDNGSNHTQLCVRFPNGNIRVLATA